MNLARNGCTNSGEFERLALSEALEITWAVFIGGDNGNGASWVGVKGGYTWEHLT